MERRQINVVFVESKKINLYAIAVAVANQIKRVNEENDQRRKIS